MYPRVGFLKSLLAKRCSRNTADLIEEVHPILSEQIFKPPDNMLDWGQLLSRGSFLAGEVLAL